MRWAGSLLSTIPPQLVSRTVLSYYSCVFSATSFSLKNTTFSANPLTRREPQWTINKSVWSTTAQAVLVFVFRFPHYVQSFEEKCKLTRDICDVNLVSADKNKIMGFLYAAYDYQNVVYYMLCKSAYVFFSFSSFLNHSLKAGRPRQIFSSPIKYDWPSLRITPLVSASSSKSACRLNPSP